MMASFYIIVSAVFCLSLYIYRLAYPRPYPNIPYNHVSAKRFWGDLPDLREAVKTTKDPAKFVFQQCRKLRSPVIQLFLRPFSKPIIFIDDAREVKDIIGMRTQEFDRAPSTQAVFEPFLPHSSIIKRTTPEWRDQRRFWEGLMGKAFLHGVVAPKMHGCALELVELFKAKASVANGRPFPCHDDFDVAAFDVIWTSIFGPKLDALKSERNGILEGAAAVTQPVSKDSPAIIPVVPKPEIFEAVAYFTHGIEKTLTSFSQRWHHWLLRQLPKYKRYWAMKNRTIDGYIKDTRTRLADLSEDQIAEVEDTCAMDMALRRERLDYKDRFGKVVPPTTKEIHDELYMFLIAGHETTAVTLSWSVKFLTNNPEKQDKLRKALMDAFPEILAGVQPSVEDILTKSIPYMDASLEEFIRLGNIHPRLVRIATIDTQVLGYPIPKGAQVLSSSYVGEEPLDILEGLRSKKAQQAKGNFRSYWDSNGMEDFVPERWIAEDGSYDPKRFPRLAFSAGPRVCYGKRLALQELRITLTLLILNFKFEALPDDLNSMRGFQRILRVPQQCYIRLKVL